MTATVKSTELRVTVFCQFSSLLQITAKLSVFVGRVA